MCIIMSMSRIIACITGIYVTQRTISYHSVYSPYYPLTHPTWFAYTYAWRNAPYTLIGGRLLNENLKLDNYALFNEIHLQ